MLKHKCQKYKKSPRLVGDQITAKRYIYVGFS